MALRPTQSSLVYAALLIHALNFIPQVRFAVAQFRPDPEDMQESGLSGTGDSNLS